MGGFEPATVALDSYRENKTEKYSYDNKIG